MITGTLSSVLLAHPNLVATHNSGTYTWTIQLYVSPQLRKRNRFAQAKPHCFEGHPAIFPKKIPHEQKDPQKHKSWFSKQITKSPNWQIIWNWFTSHQLLSVAIPGVTGNRGDLVSLGEARGGRGARSRTSEAPQTWAIAPEKSTEKWGKRGRNPVGEAKFFGGTAGTGDSGVYGVTIWHLMVNQNVNGGVVTV